MQQTAAATVSPVKRRRETVPLNIDDFATADLTNAMDVEFKRVYIRSAVISLNEGCAKQGCRDAIIDDQVRQVACVWFDYVSRYVCRLTPFQGNCSNCGNRDEVKLIGNVNMKIASSMHSDACVAVFLRAGCAEEMLRMSLVDAYAMKTQNARGFLELQQRQVGNIVNVVATVLRTSADVVRLNGVSIEHPV